MKAIGPIYLTREENLEAQAFLENFTRKQNKWTANIFPVETRVVFVLPAAKSHGGKKDDLSNPEPELIAAASSHKGRH